MRFLVTRPKSDAERTAAALRSCGHEVVIAPVVHIETIADVRPGPGPWAAILITSANAALTVAAHPHFAHLRGVPVFAVGRRSAQATRAAGFTDVTSADGNVDDLLRLIAARAKPEAPLLYLAGEERSGDLAAGLGGQGHRVVTTVVYRAVAVASLPPAAAAALAGEIAGVLHFSRRSAEAYVNAALAAGLLGSALKPAHFCLSAAVAEPLARAGAARIRVAARPVEAALIELIGGA